MLSRTSLLLSLCLLVCAGCGKKEKSTPQLLNDLKGGQEKDRLIAVRKLPSGKDDAAQIVPALIAALKDSGDDIRLSAAIKLGVFGDKAREAIPALEESQRNDTDARVRTAAAKALRRIDPNLTANAASGLATGQ